MKKKLTPIFILFSIVSILIVSVYFYINKPKVNKNSTAEQPLLAEYSREGGIAGFCDKLYIYKDGKAKKINECRKHEKDIEIKQEYLDVLRDFADKYSTTTIKTDDGPFMADGMKTNTVLYGRGTNKMDKITKREFYRVMNELFGSGLIFD